MDRLLKLNSQRMRYDSRGRQLKYGRICAYFLSPIPLTLFRSSALRNGRAAIIRAAITCPIPGTVVSSFSVAVLTSILPSGVFALPCNLLGLGALPNGTDAPGFGLEKGIAGVARGRGFSAGMKKLKDRKR